MNEKEMNEIINAIYKLRQEYEDTDTRHMKSDAQFLKDRFIRMLDKRILSKIHIERKYSIEK